MSSLHILLEQLLVRHRVFLSQADMCINADMDSVQNEEFNVILALLSHRIKAHQTSLRALEKNMHSGNDAVRWGPIQVTRDREGAGIVLTVRGPAAEDEHTILVGSEANAQAMETQIRKYDKMSKSLARAYSQELDILKLRRFDNGSKNQQDFVDSDQTRIALLRQYNDLRDVAQQLIGIVADNRSVPVRSLYTDGAYGVGPED